MTEFTLTEAPFLQYVRETLKAIEKRAQAAVWDAADNHEAGCLGKFAEAVDAAEGSIFNALNVAHSYLNDECATSALAPVLNADQPIEAEPSLA